MMRLMKNYICSFVTPLFWHAETTVEGVSPFSLLYKSLTPQVTSLFSQIVCLPSILPTQKNGVKKLEE